MVKDIVNPYSVHRNGWDLLLDPDSGYWEVVPQDKNNKTINFLNNIQKNSIYLNHEQEKFDSDIYPLECVLYLTNKCNFSCNYCYSASTRESDWRKFDFSSLKKIARMLLREPNRNNLCFLLFGGESLTSFDLIKDIVEYINNVNMVFRKNVTFRMQTNGSLFDERKIEFLAKNNIGIGISIDGPEYIHNRNRHFKNGKGTHKEVLNGIRLLKEYEVPFSVIATVGDPEEVPIVFDYFLTERITNRVKISPVLPEGLAKTKDFGLLKEYSLSWAKHNILAARKLIKNNSTSSFKMREGNINSMIRHLVTEYRPDLCLRTPCGAGYGMIEFHPDGSLATCDKTLYSPELGVVGNINEIPESTSLLKLLDESPLINDIRSRVADRIPKCSSCPYKRHCGGACTLGSYDYFKDFFREDVMCDYRYYMFEELIWLLAENPSNALLLTMPEITI